LQSGWIVFFATQFGYRDRLLHGLTCREENAEAILKTDGGQFK